MSEILMECLTTVVLISVFILSIVIGKETAGCNRKNLNEEIGKAVTTAVLYTSQTYVDALKEKGVFNREAQACALRSSLDVAMQILSPAAKSYIEESFENVENYLISLIEAEVKQQKSQFITLSEEIISND